MADSSRLKRNADRKASPPAVAIACYEIWNVFRICLRRQTGLGVVAFGGWPILAGRHFYDFVVFTGKERIEKLRYMHRNPVQRGLVLEPQQWSWSSYRHYADGERGVVLVNEEQKAELKVRTVA